MEFQWHMTMWNTLERLQIKTIIVTITCMTNVICKFSVCIGYVWRFCRRLCLYNRKRRQCLKFKTAREQIKSRTSTLWFNLHMHLPMSNVFSPFFCVCCDVHVCVCLFPCRWAHTCTCIFGCQRLIRVFFHFLPHSVKQAVSIEPRGCLLSICMLFYPVTLLLQD